MHKRKPNTSPMYMYTRAPSYDSVTSNHAILSQVELIQFFYNIVPQYSNQLGAIYHCNPIKTALLHRA